uniref:Ubiquitin-like protease family profile domain-containing protein n=1 Tax=Cannabis sativa TaxID=3483 RepID=A0A803QVH3_CANSA
MDPQDDDEFDSLVDNSDDHQEDNSDDHPEDNSDDHSEDVSDDHPEDDNDDHLKDANNNERKTRGKAICKEVLKASSEGRNYEVEYNRFGRAMGKGGTKMNSMIGMLARTTLPLNKPHWKKVPVEKKNKIWNEIKNTFKLSNSSKTNVLKEAGKTWRNWKTRMTKDLIYEYKDVAPQLLEKPPKDYINYYSPEDWKGFVATRLTPEWEELRKRKQASQAQNKYPHRTGRGGYALIEQNMEKELGRELTEYDRSEMWKRARMNNKGEVIDEEAREVVQRIEKYKKKVADGEIMEEGSNDVLTMALGTPEHGGRVRGVGSHVILRQFFHTPAPRRLTQKKSSVDEDARYKDLEDKWRQSEDKINKLMAFIQSQQSGVLESQHAFGSGVGGASNTPQAPYAPPPHSQATYAPPPPSQATYAPPPPSQAAYTLPPLSQAHHENKCKLCIGSINNIVAEGTLITINCTELRTVKSNPRYCRVRIDVVHQKDAILPKAVTRKGYTLVGQVIGYEVAWPKKFVLCEKLQRDQFSPSTQQPRESRLTREQVTQLTQEPITVPLTPTLNCLKKLMTRWTDGRVVEIPSQKRVFGFPNVVRLMKYDIENLCNYEMLGENEIQLYMWMLDEQVHTNGLNHLYAFMHPALISTTAGTDEVRADNLFKRFLQMSLETQFLICPWKINTHWMLVLIQPHTHSVAFLDPMNSHFREEIRDIIIMAFDKYHSYLCKAETDNSKLCVPKCPNQSRPTECGYYIMKFAKELTSKPLPKQYLRREMKRTTPYTAEEINDLRDEWAESIFQYLA